MDSSRRGVEGCPTPPQGIQAPRNPLFYKRLNANAGELAYRSPLAAGLDLQSAESCLVPARERRLISTGISVAIPQGCYGRVAPRSGLSLKHFVDVGGGVIDEDYRGEVFVLFFNFSDVDFAIQKGDRIAQLICEPIHRPLVFEIFDEELSKTERGANGFGSTGD